MDVDKLPIAILVVELSTEIKIVYANEALHRLFGYESSELVGEKYEKPLGIGRDLHGRKKDGTLFFVEIGLYPYEDKVMAVVSDISIRQLKSVIHDLSDMKTTLEKTVKRLENITNKTDI